MTEPITEPIIQAIHLEIKLFGAFRKFQSTPVSLEVAAGSTATEVKAALWAHLQARHPGVADASLLAASALSTDRQVLAENDTLNQSQSLAILPPVCGG